MRVARVFEPDVTAAPHLGAYIRAYTYSRRYPGLIQTRSMGEAATILVIVDVSADRHPCIDHAARMAQLLGARIELYSWEGRRSDGSRDERCAHRPDVLEPLARALRARGLSVTCQIEECASGQEGVLRHITATKPDLVIYSDLLVVRPSRQGHGSRHDGTRTDVLQEARGFGLAG